MVFRLIKLLIIAAIVISVGLFVRSEFDHHWNNKLANDLKVQSVKPPLKAKEATTQAVNPCATNTTAKLLLVSVSQRRVWACAANRVALSTPVITGNENVASDLTPVGSYLIIKKQTSVHLIGCDVPQHPTDCWNDFVNYDMIFLYNQYGHYDFHDATWRQPNDFGNISPYTSNASHGCVETPLTAMTWIYNWAPVGTTVTVES